MRVDDYDGDGVTDLMVKFSRSDIISYIVSEEFTEEIMLSIKGNVNCAPFSASKLVTIK